MDPQTYPEEAIGIVRVLKQGTGALEGFHGVAYAKIPWSGMPIESWATYHFDP